ncbi:unnamed protein product, partial [Didymodactylos carnosus]
MNNKISFAKKTLSSSLSEFISTLSYTINQTINDHSLVVSYPSRYRRQTTSLSNFLKIVGPKEIVLAFIGDNVLIDLNDQIFPTVDELPPRYRMKFAWYNSTNNLEYQILNGSMTLIPLIESNYTAIFSISKSERNNHILVHMKNVRREDSLRKFMFYYSETNTSTLEKPGEPRRIILMDYTTNFFSPQSVYINQNLLLNVTIILYGGHQTMQGDANININMNHKNSSPECASIRPVDTLIKNEFYDSHPTNPFTLPIQTKYFYFSYPIYNGAGNMLPCFENMDIQINIIVQHAPKNLKTKTINLRLLNRPLSIFHSTWTNGSVFTYDSNSLTIWPCGGIGMKNITFNWTLTTSNNCLNNIVWSDVGEQLIVNTSSLNSLTSSTATFCCLATYLNQTLLNYFTINIRNNNTQVTGTSNSNQTSAIVTTGTTLITIVTSSVPLNFDSNKILPPN